MTAVIALLAAAAPASASTVPCRQSWADTCIDVSAAGQVTGWARVDTAFISGDAYFTAANVYVVQCRGDLTGCTSKFAAGSNHGAHVNIVSTGNPGAHGHVYKTCASYTVYTNDNSPFSVGPATFHEVNVCSGWRAYS